MKNKYWLSLLILGTLVVILAACSSENPEGASESASDVTASEEIVDTSKDVGASNADFTMKEGFNSVFGDKSKT